MYHYKYSNGARSRFVIKVVGIGGTAAEEDDSRRLGCTRAVRWRWNRRGRWRWRTRSRRRGSVGRGQGLGEGDDAVRQEVFVVTELCGIGIREKLWQVVWFQDPRVTT